MRFCIINNYLLVSASKSLTTAKKALHFGKETLPIVLYPIHDCNAGHLKTIDSSNTKN